MTVRYKSKMAIGVDTSQWKPRKIVGTPAAKVRNYIALGILGVGVLCGAFYQFSGLTEKYRKALDPLYEDPVEEVERRLMIASGLPVRSGDQIRELEERFDSPDRPEK